MVFSNLEILALSETTVAKFVLQASQRHGGNRIRSKIDDGDAVVLAGEWFRGPGGRFFVNAGLVNDDLCLIEPWTRDFPGRVHSFERGGIHHESFRDHVLDWDAGRASAAEH